MVLAMARGWYAAVVCSQPAARCAIAAANGVLSFIVLLVLLLVVYCSSSLQPHGAIVAGLALLLVDAARPLRMLTCCISLIFNGRSFIMKMQLFVRDKNPVD